MGNHRFKLSDMMPNAWFYKLKDMSRSRKRNGSQAMKNKPGSPTTSHRSQPMCSNYFPTQPDRAGSGNGNGNGKILYNSPIFTKASDFSFIDSPRRSSKRRARRKAIYFKPSSPTLVSSSVSVTTSSCHSTNNWTHQNPTHSPDYYASSVDTSSESHEYVSSESGCDDDSVAAPDLFNALPSNCSCRVSSSTNDIIIDMNNEVGFTENSEKLDGFEPISEVDLPPILTKPLKYDKPQESGKSQRERKSSPVARKSSAGSTGIRLRANSPKLASRKVQGFARRKASRNTGFPEGFAVVKSSFDPETDFRDSMVEMIMENNIRASKDLEDLLACYLSLNSSEYHELIVKAFEQIWIDMAQLRL